METMKSECLTLFIDRDVSVKIIDEALIASKEMMIKFDELTLKLKSPKDSLESTHGTFEDRRSASYYRTVQGERK